MLVFPLSLTYFLNSLIFVLFSSKTWIWQKSLHLIDFTFYLTIDITNPILNYFMFSWLFSFLKYFLNIQGLTQILFIFIPYCLT